MTRYRQLGGLLAITIILMLISGCAPNQSARSQTYHAELEYLKDINLQSPPEDPQIIFLLMQQYINSNQQADGIETFNTLIDRYDAQLEPWRKALYLSALGLMRASHANEVPLLRRIRWVNETIDILERARELSQNNIFVIRWITGVVYAQLPARFGMHETAQTDLQWCVDNLDKAPGSGWLREVYYQLGSLAHQQQDDDRAQKYLRLSGYPDFNKSITLSTNFTVTAQKGFTFQDRELKTIVPDKVYALSGFEFTEYFFIVSDDQRELIAIDAGTRPDSAEAAYTYLQRQVSSLPPLTTVLITHSHWDHIGGHRYFRHVNPQVRFYARDNYHEEMAIVANYEIPFKFFFGTDYNQENVRDFKPDVRIDQQTTVTIGGTRFDLIPVPGGETVDGMLISMPDDGVLFVGDFIMPYLGAPFVSEGSLPGLFEAIDMVADINPKHLLHGHRPLTDLFDSTQLLITLKKHLEWLHDQTLQAIYRGADRATTQQQNLMPPFLHQHPEVHLHYLVLRENVINRLYDQHTGYWQTNLDGMDTLTHQEFGVLLTQYLGLSEHRLTDAVDEMVCSGDYELAARTLAWSLTQFPNSPSLTALKQSAFLKLKEKYQSFNPFKFIIYSEQIGHETPPLNINGVVR